MEVASKNNFLSLAFPVLGAGAGNFPELHALEIMRDELEKIESNLHVVVVRYQNN